MSTLHLCTAACLAFSMAAVSPAVAGPWPVPEGEVFAVNTLTFHRADNGDDGRGLSTGDGTLTRWEYSPYIEYGLTDTITLGANPRFQHVVQETGQGDNTTTGFGDLDLFARTVAWRDDYSILAFQGLVKVPTGYDKDANPALGNGQVDLDPRVLFGHGFSLGSWPSFAEVQLGYRYRFGDPSDEVRVDTTIGTNPTDDIMVMLQTFNIVGISNETNNGSDFDLYKVQFSGVYDVTPNVALQLGGYSEVAGRNINLGEALFTAVWLRF